MKKHHGGILGHNNPTNEKGATFSFSLPVIDSSKRFEKQYD
jgi:hypothetical protein